MKKVFRKIIILILALVVIVGGTSIYQARQLSAVKAFGDLTVDFHTVTAGDPIFVINNMMPGDSESRVVDVTNSGTLARFVTVKGIKKSETGNLSTVLSIVVREGAIDRYGGTSGTGLKHLSDFFADSAGPNGVQLSILGSGAHTAYTFIVSFDTSAGNPFQGKQVVFDLTFGIINGDNLVINEVYYQPDGTHGSDSPKDRGVYNIIAQNINTGPGSINIAKVKVEDLCKIIQKNNSNINNNISINTNTGNNSASGNTGGGSVISGAISVIVNIFNSGNINQASCGKKLGQNDEWIEIYNPTDHKISLKNWKLVDNSGAETIIHTDKKVPAGGFALISKDADTWKFWNENPAALKVELGQQIGDGFDNSGDHLILKNPSGQVIDSLSYGADTSVFNPSIPLVPLGSSFERKTPGFDTDTAFDFVTRTLPTPGN